MSKESMLEGYLDSYKEAFLSGNKVWMEDIHEALKDRLDGVCLCSAYCSSECLCGAWDE